MNPLDLVEEYLLESGLKPCPYRGENWIRLELGNSWYVKAYKVGISASWGEPAKKLIALCLERCNHIGYQVVTFAISIDIADQSCFSRIDQTLKEWEYAYVRH